MDTTDDGEVRSQKWNSVLLRDLISPLYKELLLESSLMLVPGEYYNQLWLVDVNRYVWKKILTLSVKMRKIYLCCISHYMVENG